MRFCSASNGDAAAFGADLRAIIGPMRAFFAESGFVLGTACFGYNSVAVSGNVFSNAGSHVDELASTVVCQE